MTTSTATFDPKATVLVSLSFVSASDSYLLGDLPLLLDRPASLDSRPSRLLSRHGHARIGASSKLHPA
jgi:hypothetical protein